MKTRLITWISVVSAILTIGIALTPLLSNKVKLGAYIEGAPYLTSPSALNLDNSQEYPQLDNEEELENIYRIVVTNNGSLDAEGVSIVTPYDSTSIEALIYKINKTPQRTFDLNGFRLGDLKPSEEIIIYIWTSHNLDPSQYSGSNIIISHSKGLATLHYDIDGSGLTGTIYRNRTLIFFAAITFFAIMFFLSVYLLIKKRNTTAKSENSATQKFTLLKEAWENGIINEQEYQSLGHDILKSKLYMNDK